MIYCLMKFFFFGFQTVINGKKFIRNKIFYPVRNRIRIKNACLKGHANTEVKA